MIYNDIERFKWGGGGNSLVLHEEIYHLKYGNDWQLERLVHAIIFALIKVK